MARPISEVMTICSRRLIAFNCFMLALLLPMAGLPQNLFGTVEFPVAATQSLPRWEDLLYRFNLQRSSMDACAADRTACASTKLLEWYDLLQQAKGKSPLKQLDMVNRFINRSPYKTDWQAWGKSDYWATPLEFMDRSGDCEDYSFYKYVTLQHLGFKPEQLRMVVVQDTIRNIPHAILAVYVENDIMILDSLFDRPLSHTRVLQYSPYYSVNEFKRWAHVKPMAR